MAGEVVRDVVKVRKELERTPEVNLWNSYMLICFDKRKKLDLDLLMKVEKDTTAIRKYIILKESDLDRVPFLDASQSETVVPKKVFNDESFSGFEEIQDLVNHIRELTFKKRSKLTYQQIKKILEQKYMKGALNVENQIKSEMLCKNSTLVE